jgi:alkylation response protein AidB-like acyl-CoA dehydrogenase
MLIGFTEKEDAFRNQVRQWLQANVPDESLPSGDTKEGFALHLQWEKKLFDAGWAVPSWPEEFGGRGATLMEWLIFEEEYYALGAPQRVTQNGIFLLGPALLEFGTEEQKARLLRPMASGEQTWAQGWSEPGAGSDLAHLSSSARRVEGGWRLSGQKTWCTRAAFCDWMYGLFRSDPDAERPHKGLTYFMVPLDAEGVTVRGFGRLDGDEGFADVFLDDVFVPDRDVLGEVNRGWYVAMSTTNSERGLTLRSPGRFLATAERLRQLYLERGASADPGLKREVVKAWMNAEAYQLYVYQTATKMQEGKPVGFDASINKVFWSDMDVHMHETALALLGDDAELDSSWMKGYQFALAGPIYAGTNEIQRNVIAERVLGLPRK